jgi:acyl-CoA thioesterase-1
MPLGDSLTVGVSATVTAGQEVGYRSPLYTSMIARGDKVDFVGSQLNGTFSSPLHEGHSGYRTDNIDAGLSTWLPAAKPQVILLMAGTNDVSQGLTTAAANMSTLLDHIASLLPNARIYVSSIPPIDPAKPGGSTTAANLATAYNAALPGVVSSRAAAGVNVHYINAAGSLSLSDLDSGGVHLTPTGYSNLAAAWLAGLPSPP